MIPKASCAEFPPACMLKKQGCLAVHCLSFFALTHAKWNEHLKHFSMNWMSFTIQGGKFIKDHYKNAELPFPAVLERYDMSVYTDDFQNFWTHEIFKSFSAYRISCGKNIDNTLIDDLAKRLKKEVWLPLSHLAWWGQHKYWPQWDVYQRNGELAKNWSPMVEYNLF